MASPALNRVMDQAAAAAAKASTEDAAPNLPATTEGDNGGAVTNYVAPKRPSLDSMADNSGITVDAYLSVKETGLRIDKNPWFQKTRVRIDLTEVVPIYQVRVTKGGLTTFLKSYDGLMTNTGQSFDQATKNAYATAGANVTGPYETVEIPATLLEDVPGAEAGKVLGITPPVTGAKFWTKFYKKLRSQSLHEATVDVEIECIPQSNTKGNDWGVVGFTLIGEADLAE